MVNENNDGVPNFLEMQPFLERMEVLFNNMDRTYATVADQYGFRCRGCDDNCCLTRFYHHTWVEYFFLERGVSGLSPDVGADIRNRSRDVCRKMEAADREGQKPRVMCPLNRQDLCLVYDYRPMICRLHGMPHELRNPAGEIYQVPGCDEFSRQCGEPDYLKFNRTPLYLDMARLEHDFRQAFGLGKKTRATIAEMIVRMPFQATPLPHPDTGTEGHGLNPK
jgi:Fe-S-cluster containining protein